jgi:hypothetical protein
VTVEYLDLADYLAIASGEWEIPELAEWLRRHLAEPD